MKDHYDFSNAVRGTVVDKNTARLEDGSLLKKVPVVLAGEDGNAFSIMARVSKVLRKEGYSKEVIEEYQTDATSGDYDHLLQVTLKYAFHVNENDEPGSWEN